MTTAAEEDWMELAARDDHLVAKLLLRLCRAVPPSRRSVPGPALPLDWSVRHPRSGGPRKEQEDRKGKSKQKQQKEEEEEEKAAEPTRASPSTPLSWSGATSTSGGVEGAEESSRPDRPASNARSKVSIFTATANSTAHTTRRAKRKKTLAELKHEESLLMKERRSLRHELTALRLTLAQERAKNEIFKREKLVLQLQHTQAIAAKNMTAGHEPTELLPRSRESNGGVTQPDPPTNSTSKRSEVERHVMVFELPDLNAPVEDHCGAEILYGTR